MRVLALLPDAFGGRGGIAKFNRDLLTALTQHPAITQVTALPRRIDEAAGALPRGLDYRTFAARGKAAFAAAMLGELARARRHDLVIAGHLNLLPLAAGVHLAGGGSLGLAIHGVEAWTPSERPFVAPALRRMSWFLAVSEYTKERFLRWAPVSPAQGIVVPNTVDTTLFSPGPRRADLLARYGLSGRTVVMTLARLDGRERCKVIDEVMEALRLLPAAIAYLVCGDGTDRARLEAKAAELGLADPSVSPAMWPNPRSRIITAFPGASCWRGGARASASRCLRRKPAAFRWWHRRSTGRVKR